MIFHNTKIELCAETGAGCRRMKEMDENIPMEEKIIKLYKKWKGGRIKNALSAVVFYFLMMIIVSIFFGNPFSHRETLLFFEVWEPGWISTRPYLLVLCGGAAIFLTLFMVCYKILKSFKKFDDILQQQCDPKQYLEVISYGVSYGKELRLKGYQKSVFQLMQQRYALALMVNAQLEESRRFLNEGWIGKKKAGIYKNTVFNLELVEAYQQQDVERYSELYNCAGRSFKKNRLFGVQKLFLEHQYKQAADILEGYKVKTAYNNVIRSQLLGQCYDNLGDRKRAEECMRYVLEYGNTMPAKAMAEEWLTHNREQLV